MGRLNYTEIIERMRWAGKLKNNSATARVLGITPQALSNCKKRGEMPANLVIKFALIYGLSVDWLLTGNGEACGDKDGKDEFPFAEKSTSPYLTYDREFQRFFAKTYPFNPDEIIYLGKLLKILRTPDQSITFGIKCCIYMFLKVIEHHLKTDNRTEKPADPDKTSL